MNPNLKNSWMINGLLAVILVLLVSNYVSHLPSAKAAGGSWDTDGVMVLSTTGAAERMFLVDTKNQNIMVYRSQNAGIFGLIGARSYKYDIEIEDTAPFHMGNGLTYAQVKKIYDDRGKAAKP